MSDPEATLFYAKVGRISFDGIFNPLDFLHAIKTRTQTAYTVYQRVRNLELSVEGPALDWFMQVVQPQMATITWAKFRERFMRRFCPKSIRMS